jgi:hypothetical protein
MGAEDDRVEKIRASKKGVCKRGVFEKYVSVKRACVGRT